MALVYKEGDNVEIVRLANVHTERRYLYCSLCFFSKNQIITVRHTFLKGTKVVWRIRDNGEYHYLISKKQCHEITKGEELLKIDFNLLSFFH